MHRRTLGLAICPVILLLALGGCQYAPRPASRAVSGEATITASSASPTSVPLTARNPSPAARPVAKPSRSASRASKAPQPPAPQVGHLYGMRLPTTANELELWLGRPDHIELPADVPNPDGQWFSWGRGRSSETFSAMNDDYDDTVDLRSPVWFVKLRANRRGLARRTLLGFVFNRTTKEHVERTFGGRLVPCHGRFGAWNLKYYHKGLWTYFFFSSDARLVGIAQGTSDLDNSG